MDLSKSKLFPEQMDKTPDKYWTLSICLMLALTTFAVYWQVHTYDFVRYDDDRYVTENPNVTVGLTQQSVIWALTTGYFSNWHPLTWLSHMLDCEMFGLNPGPHHLTNLFLHIANALLLFIILKRMTNALWQSAFVAAAFALHPLHVESVVWIAERKDVLSTLFWLLTVGAYMRYVKRPRPGRYLFTLLVFAMGIMSKPTVVTLPFVLLLLDYWPFGRFPNAQTVKDAEKTNHKFPDISFQWRTFYRLAMEKVPFLALSVFSSIVTYFSQRTGSTVVPLHYLPVISRIANAVISYVKYMGKMIWPDRLAVFYPHSSLGAMSFGTGTVWLVASILILLVISIYVIRLARSHKYLPVGWLWYLGTLVPVIGLVQVGGQGMADRYSYVSFTGLFIIIAWAAPELIARWRYKKIALTAAVVVLTSAMMITTRRQVRHWQNSYTLFNHAVAVTENNSNMYYNLGVILANEGRFDEAVMNYRQALRISPNIFNAQSNLGIILFEQGEYDQAIECFKKAVQLKPDDHSTHHNLGLAYLRQGKLDKAEELFQGALQIKSDWPQTHNKLGTVYLQQGKLDKATTHLEYSVELKPDQPEVHRDLGLLFHQQGNFERVLYHWQKALELIPDNIEFMNNLAWIMATHQNPDFRDPQKAIRLAERACELSNYKIPGSLDTLSAAYAAAKRFDEAVTTAEKAIDLAMESGLTKLAEDIRKRLSLYKANKPYTEPPPET
ncbi:MAG: tetratricopeptide repeat protein [Planctomycetota bacterium]|jgi:tetratricopeptide (TPR) repeat protein